MIFSGERLKRVFEHILRLLPMDDRCCACGRRLRVVSGVKPRFCGNAVCGVVDNDLSEPLDVVLERWRKSRSRPGDGEFMNRDDELVYSALMLLAGRLRVVEIELHNAKLNIGSIERYLGLRNP